MSMESRDALKGVLRAVGWDAEAAKIELEKQHAAANTKKVVKSRLESHHKAVEEKHQKELAARLVVNAPADYLALGTHKTANSSPKKGGRLRSDEVEEVQKYIYDRWIKGDKLSAIRAGAVDDFGAQRAPKEDAHITLQAKRYAAKHGLSTTRRK